MDLLMPRDGRHHRHRQIRRILPDTEVIALTSVLEDDQVVGAVRAGAIGYLLKNTEADELLPGDQGRGRRPGAALAEAAGDWCARCERRTRPQRPHRARDRRAPPARDRPL